MASDRPLDAIADDSREARVEGDRAAMARLRNEETCVVLLTLLGPASWVAHGSRQTSTPRPANNAGWIPCGSSTIYAVSAGIST